MNAPIRLTISSPQKVYTFTAKENSVIIGRSLKIDFVIPKEDLSREHCRFEREGEKFFITDLGSKNGTVVDRKKLAPHERVQVTPKSEILLSNIYLLKINPIEVKGKLELIDEKHQSEIETATFSLDLAEIPEEKPNLPSPWRKQPFRRSKEGKKKSPVLLIVIGILILIGLYQAFGR